MSGKDLKEKLKAAGVNLSELSKLMGYKTDQNLHSVLGAKEMNSSVIERMAEVLGKPIGWFYGEEELVAEPERETEPDTVPLLPIFAQAGRDAHREGLQLKLGPPHLGHHVRGVGRPRSDHQPRHGAPDSRAPYHGHLYQA